MISLDDKSQKGFLKNRCVIELKSGAEIEILRKAGKAAAKVLRVLGENIRPGINTKFLDSLAEKEISSLGLKPAFLGYQGFPASVCVSINDELVHGIPSAQRMLKEGDIVSVDLGVICEDFYGDTAATFAVGKISAEAQKLIDVTKESLKRAVSSFREGSRLGDVSYAVQSFAEQEGFSVVRDYVGHGIGRRLHEEPSVPNYGKPGSGIRLCRGMVLAIEPMVNAGGYQVQTLDDGWTVATKDGKLCAHFEHMAALTEKGTEILTEI